MKSKIKNTTLFIFFIIILLSIIFAFIVEYRFGHQPCNLCLYERIPYFLSAILIFKLFFFKKYEKITILILSLIFAFSTILAFYHFGIEQGFFNESFACKIDDQLDISSKEQLLREINRNTISCKDVTFSIFGFSLATINTILSFIFTVTFVRLFLNYEKN